MKSIVLTLASALAMAPVTLSPRAATAQAGPMDAVHRFVDAFNKGDVAAAAASCAEQTSIIDEFAPYEWHGAGACARWMGDYDADAKRNAITGGVVTLGAPRTLMSAATALTSWSPPITPMRSRANR